MDSQTVNLPVMADCNTHDAAYPHWVFRPRGASLWVLEYSAAGSAELVLPGGEKREIGAGVLFAFAPGAYQNYGMEPHKRFWEHTYICFPPRKSWHELLLWPQLYRGAHILELAPAQHAGIEEHLRETLRQWRTRTHRREDFLFNLTEHLLLTLDAFNPLSLSGRLDERIRRCMEHIRANFTSGLDISALAALCNLSPSRFSHLFRQQTGLTPMKYLLQQRLEYASSLLSMSAIPVAQVAREAGFDNPLYFSRIFSAHYGTSPRAFRKGNLRPPSGNC